MGNKIICCSFEKGSMGGFMTICNGVGFKRPEHYSKTIAITREAFIAACKDRVLFNDILGIDIRNGWQNALSAAIQCFNGMQEDFDPEVALNASSELDVQMRGEDAVQADIDALEKQNDELDKEIKKAKSKGGKKGKEKPVADEEPAQPEPVVETPEIKAEMDKVADEVVAAEQGQPVPQPEEPKTEEVEDGQRPVENSDSSSEDAGSESDSGVSAERPGSESAE